MAGEAEGRSLNRRRILGSAFQVGRRMAEAVGPDLPMPVASGADVAFARACREVAVAWHPAIEDVYRGFLAGGGYDPDAFLVYFFARRQGVLRGCTNLIAGPEVTAGGEVFVGRNYDWAYSDTRWCELRAVAIEGSIPFLSYTHHWIGHPDCFNGAGLFIAISSLPAVAAEAPGLQWNLLVDGVASRCRTVSEAVDALTSVPHLRAITYLLADRDGNGAAVEGSPHGTTVRRTHGGFLVATNHAVGAGDDGTDRTRHSMSRLSRAEEILSAESGRIDAETIKSILRDPVCVIRQGVRTHHRIDHVDVSPNTDWGTIWSTVARPDRGTLDIAPGNPVDVEYERVVFAEEFDDSRN